MCINYINVVDNIPNIYILCEGHYNVEDDIISVVHTEAKSRRAHKEFKKCLKLNK